ncbi:hypothetical protein J2Z52_001272 [Enterococcus rivorum]|nr:hypothetical protein [Enterococcus rivorum]
MEHRLFGILVEGRGKSQTFVIASIFLYIYKF